VCFLSDLHLHKYRIKPSAVQTLEDWSRNFFPLASLALPWFFF
jgi:hypothetical protein